MTYEILIDGKPHKLELARNEHGWQCRLDGNEVHLDAVPTRRDVVSIIIDGQAYEIKREQTAQDLHIWVKSARYAAEVRDPRSLRSRRAGAKTTEGPQKLLAPMPGKVVRILVSEKDVIEAGKGLLVVEAMKMQNELKSPKTGTVQKILVQEGTPVNAGDVLAIVE